MQIGIIKPDMCLASISKNKTVLAAWAQICATLVGLFPR
jgi:hypothetical protein